MRIPFDSECLAAVVDELRSFVGGRVQDVRQPNGTDFLLALYAQGGEAWFLVSVSPEFARAYLTTRRPSNPPVPPAFCATLRARIGGSKLTGIETVPGERVLALDFEGEAGLHRLVIELMGKHSNAMLLEETGRTVAALKWTSRAQSVRPIVSGAIYVAPPVLGQGTGSPFLAKLRAVGGGEGPYRPVLSPGNGAYPYSVAALGLPEIPRSSLSVALEQHYAAAIPAAESASLRSSLLSSLARVLAAREAAVTDLDNAVAAGERAGDWQRVGELILAYGPSSPEGATELDAWDYDGNPVVLHLDPEMGWKANAERYFKRARKAKARLDEVREQATRLREEAERIEALSARVSETVDLADLRELAELAKANRWLQQSAASAKIREERPYEGHRIRELTAPGGWTVLYGENAEANDYLTLRVARSNDYWLHVRGGTSAHVVLQTRNVPERVQREALEFAAKIAVRHSPSKHSGFVPVDFTLKKHVRKPRGSVKGSALYSHEKTLHVDGS